MSGFMHTAKPNMFKNDFIEISDCRPSITPHMLNHIDTHTSDIAHIIRSRMTQAAIDTMMTGHLRPWSYTDLLQMIYALDDKPAGHHDTDEMVKVNKLPVNKNIGVF